jgi:hypothetical protein
LHGYFSGKFKENHSVSFHQAGMIMKDRILKSDEIEKVRDIDRSETVHQLYYLKDGQLTLKDEFYGVKIWTPFQHEASLERLRDIRHRSGILLAAFDGDRLIAASALESKFIGNKQDQLQMYFLHVDIL